MAKAALSDVRGPLNNLVDNLSGDHGSEWLDLLKRLLRKELVPKLFQTWKTLLVRAVKWTATEDYGVAILGTRADIKFVYAWIPECIISILPELQKDLVVDLVKLTVADLGFTQRWTTISEIVGHARTLGLETCPWQVALELRLVYKDQPVGEHLFVATDPLPGSPSRPDSDELTNVLHVSNSMSEFQKTSLLEVGVQYEASPDHAVFGPDDVFVFVRPRK